MEMTAINDDDRGWNVQLEYTTQIGDQFPDKNRCVDDKITVATLNTRLGVNKICLRFSSCLSSCRFDNRKFTEISELVHLLFSVFSSALFVYLNTFFLSKIVNY
jgi:hypothetical protein